MRKTRSIVAGIVILAVVGVYAQRALADDPVTLQIAIPSNVEVIVGVAQVHIIGRPTSISPVNCAPGTPYPQSAVVLDTRGSHAAQITGVLNYHDHEIANGTRFLITNGPDACNSDFKLYTGTLK